MAETCLRQQVCVHVPEKYTRWLCILPHAIKEDACKYYLKTEKVTMAQGIASIYKNVKSREARSSIRYALRPDPGNNPGRPHS